MDQWKRLICRGNRCYELGRLDEARHLYDAALQEAERCLSGRADQAGNCSYDDALAAVAAFVVTQHNLADLQVRLDRTDEAANHLMAAYEKVMGIIDDTTLPWILRAAAVRNSNQVRKAMLSFAEKRGLAGPSCALDRRITHRPASPVLH